MITSEAELEDVLSAPNQHDIEAMRRIPGDLILLGAGGKMGPSLARRARRAADAAGARKSISAVSRFSSPESRR